MSQLRGSFHRRIRPPGYHIVSHHDLHGLRHRRTGGKAHAEFDLPLTSMIDMFSMLVIFLLMNFSSTGEIFFVPTKELLMPSAEHGRQLETAPLISILTNNSVRLDSEAVGEGSANLSDGTGEYQHMRIRLQQMKAIEETSHPGVAFKGQINIQADEKTQLGVVKKIMNILISEGWTGINFAVRPEGGTKKDGRGVAGEDK